MAKQEQMQENPQKSISERLREALAYLSVDQLRFVAAMQHTASKKEAAELIGLAPNTVYKWPGVVDEAVLLSAQDKEAAAREVSANHLLKAMMVKLKGLDSDDEALRQKVASEIIEWNLGKAIQKQDVTAKIEVDDTTGLSPEQRLARVNAYAQAARVRAAMNSAPGGE